MSVKNSNINEPASEPDEKNASPIEPKQSTKQRTIKLKRSQFYAALSVITFFAGIMVGYILWGTGLANNLVVDAPIRYKIPTEGSYATGPGNAPITVVEFSDYQCPFCRQWHDQVYDQLFAAYPDKIRFVYRNFPLTTIHPEAMSAAEAAMCAGEQNVYWQYHDKLFASETLGNATYLQYAQELNLDLQKFQTCITTEKYKNAIQADADFAQTLNVSATPTFFINGIRLVGAQPLSMFKQLIDKELASEVSK